MNARQVMHSLLLACSYGQGRGVRLSEASAQSQASERTATAGHTRVPGRYCKAFPLHAAAVRARSATRRGLSEESSSRAGSDSKPHMNAEQIFATCLSACQTSSELASDRGCAACCDSSVYAC